MTQNQITRAHELFGKIDCTEQRNFMQAVNTGKQIDCRILGKDAGAFFSYSDDGNKAIICLEQDIDIYITMK